MPKRNILIGLVLAAILATYVSSCVTLEVGLEPIPTPTRAPTSSATPTIPFQSLGPDYATGIDVYGWLGRVYSLEITNPYGDILILEPQGTGIVGLRGIDDQVEHQIVGLRDTGKLANFWGTLTCGIEDFNDCQLLVKQVRPEGPGPFFDMDRVEGWLGTLIGSIPGTDYDNAFILAGDYPVEYGIGSSISLIEEAIKNLENTATGVRIWGQVICGVPDAGNCHIYVTDLNIITNSRPGRPTETPSVLRTDIQPDSTWLSYFQEMIGIELQYPPEARVIPMPASYLPPRKLPENESDEAILDIINKRFGSTLCIQVLYRAGFILISPPGNRGDKYVNCTRKPFSEGELLNKTETVLVNGTYFSFSGVEIVGDGASLAQHHETFAALLPNGFTIQYGSSQSQDITYASYLLTTKRILLAILSTITFPQNQELP